MIIVAHDFYLEENGFHAIQRELNKQKEEYNEEDQNVDVHKAQLTIPIQLKKTPLKQAVLHPKSLNSTQDDSIISSAENRRREQGEHC